MSQGPDPLYDTLFRPTDRVPRIASAAPLRRSGTHTRAGNAMLRTRAAVLAGAARAVETTGATRLTMSQIAAAAGVAKATLYNHFRTRDAVLNALIQAEVDALIAEVDQRPLPEALAVAATRLGEHPVLRALARHEPAALAGLARIDLSADAWQRARAAVETALERAGRRGGDAVLRWLASYLLSPASPSAIEADLAVLLAGLPPRVVGDDSVSDHARPTQVATDPMSAAMAEAG
jgi:AcrR family transcriptional regulator